MSDFSNNGMCGYKCDDCPSSKVCSENSDNDKPFDYQENAKQEDLPKEEKQTDVVAGEKKKPVKVYQPNFWNLND